MTVFTDAYLIILMGMWLSLFLRISSQLANALIDSECEMVFLLLFVMAIFT